MQSHLVEDRWAGAETAKTIFDGWTDQPQDQLNDKQGKFLSQALAIESIRSNFKGTILQML